MQRITARFLLLFALIGTFVPIALQATSAPAHACCRRQGTHHCIDTTKSTNEPIAVDGGCCHHDCSRAVTTAQWAHPEPCSSGASAQTVFTREVASQSNIPSSQLFSLRSTRAPPKFSIA